MASQRFSTEAMEDVAPLAQPQSKKQKGKMHSPQHQIQQVSLKIVPHHAQWLRQVHAVIQYSVQLPSEGKAIVAMSAANKGCSAETKRVGKSHALGKPCFHSFVAMDLGSADHKKKFKVSRRR